MRIASIVFTLALLGAAQVASAATAAPGYAIRTITTPGTVQGGVVARGGAVIVGQGSFGAGLEHIIRIDSGGTTTIATGFNSLGGFDLDAAGTLYVVDNGGDLGGATTGDTVYAIPNALTRTTALPALGAEVLPADSVPFAQDVLVTSDGLLVADAAGPGAGRVLKVVGGSPSDLITGLDYLGALAFNGRTLLVANLDQNFMGNVRRYSASGAPLGALATGLPASFGLAVDGTCNTLVSGEFSFDCSSGHIFAIPPGGGAPVPRATAFCSAGDLYFDGARDETLALDFGASAVTGICRDWNNDSICDADASCVGPAALIGVKLKIGRLTTPAGDDTLSLKAEATLPSSPAINPMTKGGLQVRITAGSGSVAAMLPGGAYDRVTRSGWTQNGAETQWKYKNATCPVAGIVAAKVKRNPATGLVRFSVSGKAGSYTLGPGAVQVSLQLDPAGECGVAPLTCTPSGSGATLSCR